MSNPSLEEDPPVRGDEIVDGDVLRSIEYATISKPKTSGRFQFFAASLFRRLSI